MARLLLEIDHLRRRTSIRPLRSHGRSLDAFLLQVPRGGWADRAPLKDLDPWEGERSRAGQASARRDLELPGEAWISRSRHEAHGRAPRHTASSKLAAAPRSGARGASIAPQPRALLAPQACIAGLTVDLLEAIAVSGPIRELHETRQHAGVTRAGARTDRSAESPSWTATPRSWRSSARGPTGNGPKLPASQRTPDLRKRYGSAVAAALLGTRSKQDQQGGAPRDGVRRRLRRLFWSAYQFDLPVRSYWYFVLPTGIEASRSASDQKVYRDLLRSQIAASTTDLEAARFLLLGRGGEARVSRSGGKSASRGHPDRVGLLQTLAGVRRPSADSFPRHSSRSVRDRWDYYAEQGRRLMMSRRYEGAGKRRSRAVPGLLGSVRL